ncbi:MAG: hypothetical protein WD065_05295 [Planctomycetaceae bacterium]
MTIQVKCPKCSKEYRLKDEMAGKKIRCKECETSIAVPAPKKKKAAEEPEGSISNFDLAALDLAEEERTSRAYKKRQMEDQKKVKKSDEYIDHERSDVMLGNVGKFAGLLLGVHLVSFGLLWFLSWMQWYDYIKFFGYVYKVSLGLLIVTTVGTMIGSAVWLVTLSFKEHTKFFAGNLVSSLLSWAPVFVLAGLGTRYLMRILAGEENIEDPVLNFVRPYLLALAIGGGIGIVFPTYYISTRWNRVSRATYLALIGLGIVVTFAATHALIVFLRLLEKTG